MHAIIITEFSAAKETKQLFVQCNNPLLALGEAGGLKCKAYKQVQTEARDSRTCLQKQGKTA